MLWVLKIMVGYHLNLAVICRSSESKTLYKSQNCINVLQVIDVREKMVSHLRLS